MRAERPEWGKWRIWGELSPQLRCGLFVALNEKNRSKQKQAGIFEEYSQDVTVLSKSGSLKGKHKKY